MRYSREYLNQLAAEARRLDQEARAHQRLGHFVLAADKRLAADGVRSRLQELELQDAQRRQALRFG